jgi:hypothetical protein
MLMKVWQYLSLPPLSPEAQFWTNICLFIIFALLPFCLVAYSRLVKRRRYR